MLMRVDKAYATVMSRLRNCLRTSSTKSSSFVGTGVTFDVCGEGGLVQRDGFCSLLAADATEREIHKL